MRINSITLRKVITKEIVLFSFLSSVIVFSPFFGVQAVTGAIVNAVLFLTTILLGVKSAVVLAVFPSIIALAVGFLPITIAPFIPFIITGNVILVIVFDKLESNYWKGVILASFSKFIFLFITSYFLAEALFPSKMAKIVTTMMSFPQLATALTGGLIAYIIFMLIQKKVNF
jgi:hypothetical protein